ncbi:MAG: DNA-binding response regulator [Anaerolineae bacterium]|nr:MAG: DNA-binding response regulator [Anaerolineae bacterium]
MPLRSLNSLPDTSVARVFVVCDQSDTAPIWGYIIREKGLTAIIETSAQRAMDRSLGEVPDLVVIDVNVPHAERIKLCKRFRSLTDSPILLFLPANNEAEILEAYQAGVDECVVKPISPALFMAKIMAWARRSHKEGGEPSNARLGIYLDSRRRMAIDSNGREVRLTNLEFRLLRLLMSQPGRVFASEEIIARVWGLGGGGDSAALKNVVYRLRKKLGANVIQTWPGGYSFRED